MGSGSSQQSSVASHRLRKAIIIRTYNKSVSNETLDEYFKKFSYLKASSEDGASSTMCITMESIKSSLDIDGKWADDLFQSAIKAEEGVDEFYYSDFITFIECGKLPSDHPKPLLTSTTPRVVSSKKQQLHKHINESNSISCDNTPRVNSIPIPKQAKATVSSSSSMPNLHCAAPSPIPTYHPPSTDNDTGSYVSEPDSPRSATPTTSTSSPSSACGTDMVAVERRGASVLPAGRPLWRKREVVRQERTVEYTTIDDDGQLQELVERETSETEVLHMECRDTGEFAHRETTSYEQLETFNKEKVTEQKGFEEYVHLKSADDEYEHTESSMPKDKSREGPCGQEEPVLSPRVQQQEAGGGEQCYSEEDIDGARCRQQHEEPFDDGGSHCQGATFNFDDLTEDEKWEVQAEMERWRRMQEEEEEGDEGDAEAPAAQGDDSGNSAASLAADALQQARSFEDVD